MINLLPKTEKEKLYNGLFKQQINSFGILITAVLLGGAIFIFNTYIFLAIQVNALKNSLNFEAIGQETKDAQSFETSVSQLNILLTKYQAFKNDNVPALNIFKTLEQITPPTAYLDALSFDGAKIIMAGQAQSRDDVLLLESRLKKEPTFTKLESPLSNFLNKNNPKFSFTFYLK